MSQWRTLTVGTDVRTVVIPSGDCRRSFSRYYDEVFRDYRAQYVATTPDRSTLFRTRDALFRDDAVISAENEPS